MSNLSLPCRYCCLKQREQSLPAQTEQWQEKTACLTMLQSRRKQQLWSHYSFIYGDCKLSLGVFFYLTVGSSWWGAEVWKSTQVHILFMVNFSGKTGPSLSPSLRQVMYLDPTECLTMGGNALPRLSNKWFMLLMRLGCSRDSNPF